MIFKFTQRLGLGLRSLLILIFITISALQLNAQRNKEYILKNTNVEGLRELAEKFDREYQELLQIAKEKGWSTSNLVGIDPKGNPIYAEPTNSTASAMTKTTELRNDFGVQGSGMLIGMWEATDPFESENYAARATHWDLAGRVTIMGGNNTPASHATHVAGTLIGNGSSNNLARGMAPAATLDSYGLTSVTTDMSTAAANGLLVSNHSYGTTGGWDLEGDGPCLVESAYKKWTWKGGEEPFEEGGYDIKFGFYDFGARSYDVICRNAWFYLPVFSAGNNDGQDPDDDATFCEDEVRYQISFGTPATYSTYVDYNPSTHPAGNSDERSTITLGGNAKNILTVGNLQDNQEINSSSSRGMTDDGRIKPDICGNGTDVFSTESASDSAYGNKTGTSMSAPNVSGSLLLLQQLYEQKNGYNGTYMRSATLKGLAIHTATDLGNPGPDFTYGWGLLNAEKAANVINRASYELDHRIIEVPNISEANGYSYTFFKDGPVKVTLCYTDVADTIQTVHNVPDPRLVNDLDITLVQTGGPSYSPFVMNFNNPSAWATTGDNDRDNVEQIDTNNLPDGEYTVHVNVEGSLSGTQPFSLIISGVSDGCGGDDLILGNNNVEPNVYYANVITCEGTVESGSVVSFVASGSVRLLEDNGSGFHAVAGSNFRAVALPCD